MFAISHRHSHSEGMIDPISKKRKMMFDVNATDMCSESRSFQENGNLEPLYFPSQHFFTLDKGNCDSIFQTEEWLPGGSTLFYPLTEDIMVNTRNIEQFSSTHGQFFVSDQAGQYSKTLRGQVLHLWRFSSEKQRLFISRSFLFQNHQDFLQVQKVLQRL